MAECYEKETLQVQLKLREFYANPSIEELESSDVIIFHCPLDLAFLDVIDKPSIYYNHRSGRPTTFMFNEIMRMVEPIHREVLKRDREWVNNKLKELHRKPDVILSNSKFTRRMLKKYFGVDSYVVYPPVDLDHFKPTISRPKRDYFLSVQRIHWQKRIPLQLRIFEEVNEKLVIVGSHSEDLKTLTAETKNIEYLSEVNHKKLIHLYSNAKATIQTGYNEDFGLVPIESMACGTPVICVNEGGFRETVNSKVGVLVDKPYLQNFKKALENFNSENYDSKELRKEAEKYSLERFSEEMQKYVNLAVGRHKK